VRGLSNSRISTFLVACATVSLLSLPALPNIVATSPHLDTTVVAMHIDGTEKVTSTVTKKCKKTPKKRCKKVTPKVVPASATTPPVLTQAPIEPAPIPTNNVPAPLPPVNGGSTTSYAFLSVDEATRPAHWSRCSPIRFRINPTNATQPMIDDLLEAIRRTGASSQVSFVYVGESLVIPFLTSNWYDTVYSQTHDTDVYVAFSDESFVPALAGTTIGLGGPVWTDDGVGGREPRIVLAGVLFDTNPAIPSGFGPGVRMGSLMQHELGHVMNLAHVVDPVQMMYPSLNEGSTGMFQNGDQSGLNILAAYPCF